MILSNECSGVVWCGLGGKEQYGFTERETARVTSGERKGVKGKEPVGVVKHVDGTKKAYGLSKSCRCDFSRHQQFRKLIIHTPSAQQPEKLERGVSLQER